MFWSPASGGVRRYLQAKHRWLEGQAGWLHTIAAPVADSPHMARVPSLPLPGSGGYRLPLLRSALARTLNRLAPDLLEAGDPYRLAWAVLDVARARQVPALAFCHSNIEALAATLSGPRWAGGAARAARAYARRLYRQFDLVLAPSEAMRRHLLDWGAERVACQPLGVDTELFHPGRACDTLRDQLGLSADTRLLVYAGRFAPEKHLDVLADAVRRLGPPYVLLAVGAGPTPPHGDRVIVQPFIAHPQQLASVLGGADAFVHAGDQETFGLSVLEAMACGTQVVVRRAEGLAELVDDSVGIGVTSGDADAFAQAIAALFAGTQAEQLNRALAARRRAEAHDWGQVLPSLLGHYRRLLSEAGRRIGYPVQAEPAWKR